MIKQINVLLIVLSFLGLALSLYISNEDSHFHISSDEVVETFNKQYADLEEVLLKVNPNKKSTFAQLDDLPWAIAIWKSDTLVYWNFVNDLDEFGWHKDLALEGGGIAAVHRFIKQDGEIYLDDKLCHIPLLFTTRNDKLEHTLDGLLPLARYEVSPNHKNKRGQYITLLSFLLLYISLIYSIVKYFKKKTTFASLGVIGIGLIAMYVPIEKFTKDIIVSKVLSQTFLGGFAIVDLIVVTIICIALAILLGVRRGISKTSPGWIVSIGLLSSSTILMILKMAKELGSHPSIQIEIDKIFKFDKYSVSILVCLALITLSHLLANIYFFNDAKEGKTDKGKVLPFFLIGTAISIPIFYVINLSIPFVLLYVYMVSFYTMIDLFVDTQRKNITWLIWWILILSAFLSIAIFHIGVSKSKDIRKSFVEGFFTEVNPEKEAKVLLIDSMIRKSDLFERIATPPFRGVKFDRSDLTSYISQVFDETNVTLDSANFLLEGFDQYSNSIFANHFAFENQMEQKVIRSKPISEYVYYNPIDQDHILSYEVIGDRNEATLLYILVNFTPVKTSKPKEIDFNYVIYKEGQAIYSRWAEQERLDEKELFETVVKAQRIKGFEADSKTVDGMTIIAYKKISALIKPISLFSYLFTLIGLILLLFTFINSKYSILRSPVNIKITNRSSLRNRIQFVVILLILFSFIVIGVLTSYYFNNVILNTNQKTITEQTIAIVNNINSTIRPATDNQGAFAIMHNKLDEIATIHDKALALYKRDGTLYSSSKTSDFDHRLSYNLWENIVGGKSKMFEEAAINKDLSRTFIPLYHNSNKSFGVLSIGHNSNLKTSKNLLDFLSTILNVYVFLFLLAGAIAIIIANSITRPLSVLGQKLKDFKLGRRNEPLEWKSKDEIGALIQDYNNLIVDLEKSANVIAMTERDTAWREMAKQVAHEIKNPLTPMKLSIQYLERAIQGGGDNEALIKRVSSTLIEQIDNLTQIANEFSNFASMPMASNEKLLLNDIVEMIHELFRKREDMDISLIEPITDLYVYADKNHLIRILNNILKNAIQAIPTDRRGKVKISLYKEEESAIIRVEDNGSGISDDKKDKVFTPNFTTKSSGTGLGLAISVNMIEAFNGRIYFETEVGKGTVFFVEIPLMRLDDNFDGKNRVLLD